MTYEGSTFLYTIAVAVFALGGMCGGFVGGWVANKLGRYETIIGPKKSTLLKHFYRTFPNHHLHILTISQSTYTCLDTSHLLCRKGGLLLNNIVGILGATAMGFSQLAESYELLIMGRYLIGVNCGKN